MGRAESIIVSRRAAGALLALGGLTLAATGLVPPAALAATSPAPATAAAKATGDWGFTPLFLVETLPQPPLVLAVKLTCLSAAGCTADKGLVFGPRDSAGNTVRFTGTSATSEPMIDSLGQTVGKCVSAPSPFGTVTCQSSLASIKVPYEGWVASNTTVTFTKFTAPRPGTPLASDGWSDNPKGANPGNNPDNDSQIVVSTPTPNPIEVWIDPTATAFAAGQAAQTEEVGMSCATEGFCWAKKGTRIFAALAPGGVYFPYAPRTAVTFYGIDFAVNCRFSDAGGYKRAGTNLATCSLAWDAIIDHYGEANVAIPIKASPGSYPQNHDYTLTLHPSTGMSGPGIYTDLATVAPVAITTASPLPAGTVGASYSTALAATGGVPTAINPFAPPVLKHLWSIVTGSLPQGLALAKGVIAGTPSKAGTCTFTLQVSDGQGDAVQQVFKLVVS
jgi:hypothetical protein